jgi:putative ABC transport system ATP-binding protein
LSFKTAVENVALPLLSGRVAQEARTRFSRVGLQTRPALPAEMSGGQKQRRARRDHKPRILLADEPTGALDSKTSADIMTLSPR